MQDFLGFFRALYELLEVGEDLTCASVLGALGGAGDAVVSLFEGDLTVEQALGYCVVLIELGQDVRAGELMVEAVVAAFGGRPRTGTIELATPATSPI